MFNFITNFFNKNQKQTDQFLNKDQNPKGNFYNVYNEQYRDAYNRLWIKELRDYCPQVIIFLYYFIPI